MRAALTAALPAAGVQGTRRAVPAASGPRAARLPHAAAQRQRAAQPSRRRAGAAPAARRAPLRVAAAADGGNVPVRISVEQKVKFGEVLRLVGSHPALGNWEVDNGPHMTWQEGHVWTAEVSLPAGAELEFKCVRVKSDGQGDAKWEPGSNHKLSVPQADRVTMTVDWGGKPPAPEPSRGSRLGSMDGGDGGYSSGSAGSSFDDSMALLPQWQGKELRFMQSNEHSRERSGSWSTGGLEGPALHLVAGDREAPNWLAKLGVVKELLVDQAHAQRPDLDALAHAYIYMQWIATGALECVEGGGHHRPNRHAELARMVFRSLEWVIGEQGHTSPMVALTGRRLQSRLPSFTDNFTQSVPLTRIRDIAHRNDIPKDLKAEIKHTLQNKLHRNAGPEDLHTTEAMLARITANPGEFNESFVNEFRTFTAELRDFFNAGSLTDMLDTIRDGMDDANGRLLEHFSGAKGRLDAAGEHADQNMMVDALHGVTTVRAVLVSGLSSGLRNDAPDRALAMRQKWRQCEVRAEDYAFVLLSRFINSVENKGGAGGIASGSDGAWALPIGALVLGLRYLGLGGYASQECMAVEHELAAWQKAGGFSERDNALRLKATLQRLRRLTETYSQLMLDAYAGRAEVMGRALGLERERYLVFTEAEIRASLVFQISKLCSLLIKATNIASAGSPWDVVMAGTAEGVLLRVPCLQPGCLDGAGGQDCVLLVDSATGDEEVAALGGNLRGIILRHDLPHLSHLGVRARQEGVVFVTCEDNEALGSQALPHVGSRLRLHAAADGVHLSPAGAAADGARAGSNGAGGGKGAARAVAPPVEKTRSVTVVPLQDATAATSGAKAAACGELLRLAAACSDAASSRSNGGGNGASSGTPILRAADGVVLPFGCMEAALAADGQQGRYYELLGQLRGALGSGGGSSAASLAALDGICAGLQGLLAGLRIPQQALQQVSGAFKPGATVICRSSANVEDLAGMSGAGLYESIPNVDSTDAAAVQAAVAGVWASLFSRRAVLSRHAAGVPQEAACMAVVVQQQLNPDLCFVLHTRHPVTGDNNVLSAELAPGLGETLAAGTRGSPWRLEVEKGSAAVTVAAFASFGKALLPPGAAAGLAATNGAVYAPPSSVGGNTVLAPPPAALQAGMHPQTVDYSQQPMSVSADVREGVARRLLAVSATLEHEFGAAQDVEGCFVGDDLYVVQTRPQP
ncbi:water chloroplastic [Micractinium conductrix]|uniref:Water chloroplastic n=1 Tax=Micractinium conductrix TaxID=554055 RepID=A0A2P6V4U6_9CHLO|nr:water chloroplastic [Micractinium conductrix]|eukprot:PSC69113.1 water chloroplastic [Micractinium conductrix]